MECREVTEFMLDMDNEGALPPAVQQHLQSCATCRHGFETLSLAVHSLSAEPAGATDSDLTERVMQAVRSQAPGVHAVRFALPDDPLEPDEQPTPLRSWIIVGSILLVGLFGLRFSDVMNWLRHSFGPAIDVAMSVILGVFLTGYICLLVGSNLARVRRILRLR
jgi:hypothetical protein